VRNCPECKAPVDQEYFGQDYEF